jgi:hypothetical protein
MQTEIVEYTVKFLNRNDGYTMIELHGRFDPAVSYGYQVQLIFVPLPDNIAPTEFRWDPKYPQNIAVTMNIKLLPSVLDVLRGSRRVFFTWERERNWAQLNSGWNVPGSQVTSVAQPGR